MFSCKTRGFCPSCHAKRLEEWGEWMRETLLLDVPHRQVVFTIPKMLRVFFKFKRKLLGGYAAVRYGRPPPLPPWPCSLPPASTLPTCGAFRTDSYFSLYYSL